MKILERVLWVLLAGALYVFWSTFFANDAIVVSFSPDTLQIRSQSRRSLGDTLWPGGYRYRESPVIQFLVDNNYVQPIETKQPRWIVMSYYTPNQRGGSRDLAYAFGSRTIAWCQADPERARVLWSTVFPLLRSNNPQEVRAGEAVAHWGVRDMNQEELKEFIAFTLNDFRVTVPGNAQAMAP